MIWSLFKTAVNAAIDERNKEARRTRALERIAAALEEHNGILYDFPHPPEPPKGNP
jgi:hypothetical protein